VSQDNENKTDDLDFNFNFDEENNKNGIDAVFSDNPFDFPLSDESESFETESPKNETELPESENLSFPSFSENQNEAPSNSTTNQPEEIALPEIKVDTAKKTSGKKKNKEKPKKEKKEGESIGLGAGLCLTSSGLLLLALIAVNIILLVFQPYKELNVGFSATIYYLIGFNLVGGAGIVAVPFLFYKYRKENDLFQTMLGISVMALSFAVIILMTEFLRYDYMLNPGSALPTLAPVVLSNPAPTE
jgi:hypothetical protein